VSRGDRLAGRVGFNTVEPVIDVLRRTGEAAAAVVFKQDDHDAWQVPATSKEEVHVGRACVALGGGGHARAAGFTSPWPLAEAIQRLPEALAGNGSAESSQ